MASLSLLYWLITKVLVRVKKVLILDMRNVDALNVKS